MESSKVVGIEESFNKKQHQIFGSYFLDLLDLLDNAIKTTDNLLINYGQVNRSMLFEALRKLHEAYNNISNAETYINKVDFSDHVYAKPKNKRETVKSIKNAIKGLFEDFEEGVRK